MEKMKTKLKKFIGIVLIGVVWLILLENIFADVSKETYVKKEEPKELTTHAQKVWISALEWCESRGKSQAINPKDRDGTPSYGGFQFKPSTFEMYRERYGIEMPIVKKEQWSFMHYDTQRKIIEHMINDKKVKWENEFPDCVKKKVGRPPTY